MPDLTGVHPNIATQIERASEELDNAAPHVASKTSLQALGIEYRHIDQYNTDSEEAEFPELLSELRYV